MKKVLKIFANDNLIQTFTFKSVGHLQIVTVVDSVSLKMIFLLVSFLNSKIYCLLLISNLVVTLFKFTLKKFNQNFT